MKAKLSASQIPADQVCRLFQDIANLCALLPDGETQSYEWREGRDPFDIYLEIKVYPGARAILSCDVFLDQAILVDSLVQGVAATSKHIAAWFSKAYQEGLREIDRLVRERLVDRLREQALWWEAEPEGEEIEVE